MTLHYYNGTDYGTFDTDILDLFENGTIRQTQKFFKSVLLLCDDYVSIVSELLGDVIDKLSELETLLDVMQADNAAKKEIDSLNRRIKRLKRAEELCRREV